MANEPLADDRREETQATVNPPLPEGWPPPDDTVRLLAESMCRQYTMVPLAFDGLCLTLAMADPSNRFALDDVRFATGYHVSALGTPRAAIQDVLERCFGPAAGPRESPPGSDGTTPDSPEDLAITFVEWMLEQALQAGSSDVHLEPVKGGLRVRFRIDGLLVERESVPARLASGVLARVKVLANLDISERRLPQDGTLVWTRGEGKSVSVRVATLPTARGERILLRILDKGSYVVDLQDLGFTSDGLAAIHDALRQPTGLVLVSGPRSAGLKSTLYALVLQVNTPETCILTAESPVEMDLAGVGQVQVKEELGYTFAAALNSIATQDPDVVMIQEMRDADTAKASVLTASERCLVLAAVAAEDAAAAIARLAALDVPLPLLASTLRVSVSQRGIRRLCRDCRVESRVSPAQWQQLLRPGDVSPGIAERIASGPVLYTSGGCIRCSGTGYRGRVQVTEVMPISARVREAILRGAARDEVRVIAREAGMETLREGAIIRALDGITSLEECSKVFL